MRCPVYPIRLHLDHFLPDAFGCGRWLVHEVCAATVVDNSVLFVLYEVL